MQTHLFSIAPFSDCCLRFPAWWRAAHCDVPLHYLLTLGAIGTEIRDARIRARNVARQVFELLSETGTDNPTNRLVILLLYAAL